MMRGGHFWLCLHLCSRMVTREVEANAERLGLPLALSDLRDVCSRYVPAPRTPGEKEDGR